MKKHKKDANMRYKRFFILCCVFIASLLAPSSHACTTFCLDSNDALVVGRNFDWGTGDDLINALIIVNKRNVSKTAGLDPAWIGEKPISWISKYGNVTFNPLGREFPLSGMNEVGLVVSAMRLGKATKYPEPDSRPAITAPQWIQYQLDNYATVGDVLASDLELRISNYDFWRPFHYFVCDSTGTCATIEFIDEKLVYHTQETLPVKVLANSIYSSDLEYWEKKERPKPESSPGRFYTAALRLEDYDPGTSGSAIDYTFNILSKLKWFIPNQWSIAYDILNRRINFYKDKNEDRRYVDLSSFDFLCSTPVKVLDISEDLSGDVSDNFID